MAAVFAAVVLLAPAPAQAAFGIAAFSATASSEDGSVDLQAGSHPFAYDIDLAMHEDAGGEPEGTLRSVTVRLPPGLIGNPLAVPRCRMADFDGQVPRCPGASQIGIVRADLGGADATVLPLYNLAPPPGFVAVFGFSATSITGFQFVSLYGTGAGTGVQVELPILTGLSVKSIAETIWGVPADPRHDAERTCFDTETSTFVEGCSAETAPTPLLTMPTSCTGPLQATVTVSSLEEPGSSETGSALSRDDEGNPSGIAGCGGVPFDPELAVRLDSSAADSPTGLHVGLRSPLVDEAEQPATANLRDAIVRLPAGLAINPSAAAGLLACPAGAATCPDAAQIGTAQLETPLLEEPLEGAVYLAAQGDNPFGSLLALYVVLRDPLRGVSLELAARVDLDPRSGQPTVTFEDLPQLPFAALDLDFFSGPAAIFTAPAACGEYATRSLLTPWSAPEGDAATPSASFQVTAGPAGTACVAGESEAPNRPGFEAGSLAPVAGRYSPFLVRLKRANGSQRFRDLSLTLPPGLTARLAGVRECPEAQIALACPAASEIGSVRVGAGSGPPLYLNGRVYLAGPYEGAPLSLAIVIPGLAGPLDLGTSVVRAALRVDRRTARLTLETDPFPTILQGIPLNVRSIAIDLDRPGFSRNPTSCEPTSVSGTATSVAGQPAPLSNRFQLGGCAALGFKPRLSLRLLGPAHRGANPRLRVTLKGRRGDAGISRFALTLPPTELLDNAHIQAVCTPAEFAAQACPERSIYGHARAWSPLLDAPLRGAVYLSAGPHRLPDLVIGLGGRFDLELRGRTDSVEGRLRATFPALPDAPLRKLVLTMRGGDRGLFANSGGLCRKPVRAGASFLAHNGKRRDLAPVLKTACQS